MLKRLRESAGSESGFTLIELLVVMLILGILAAIAIPAFLSQKGKANDASMKTQVRNAQTAMETCSTDNPSGNYAGCTAPRLNAIETTVPTNLGVTLLPNAANPTGYTLTSNAASGTNTTFSISKSATTGVVTRSCGPAANVGKGGCPPGGSW